MPKPKRSVCKECGIVFKGHPDRVYCSDVCLEAQLVEKLCEVCGSSFLGRDWYKVCGEECRKKLLSKKAASKARERRKKRSKRGIRAKAEILDSLLYDPDTGIFRWKDSVAHCHAGEVAGSLRVHRGNYIYIGVGSHLYQAANLAWLIMTGDWPGEGLVVDHINRDGTDNRWCNLRLLTPLQNTRNRTPRKGAMSAGVSFMSDHFRGKPFHARVGETHNGKRKRKSLGYYATEEEAAAAYMEYCKKRMP